ncbi:hypothetical protein AVEN_141687-1 [Araneus ventricosus]|uniref:Uncharacterized protein n=1 Tax=Araneus ventricosus TaxID=182803 RepID=A0A4Y2JMF8_ARAVE|nr:hypothetical protein AVEN_141687-1 [Araneus ventricosus]
MNKLVPVRSQRQQTSVYIPITIPPIRILLLEQAPISKSLRPISCYLTFFEHRVSFPKKIKLGLHYTSFLKRNLLSRPKVFKCTQNYSVSVITTSFNVISFEVENLPIPDFQPVLTIDVRRISRSTCKKTYGSTFPPHIPIISGFIFHDHSLKVVHLAGVVEPSEGMPKEEYEEWMSIDEEIPVAATITDLEICQAVCEQKQ